MRFYYILHKNNIDLMGLFLPHPQSFNKEIDNIFIMFYVHFRRIFVI